MLNYNSIKMMLDSGYGSKIDERVSDKRNKHTKQTRSEAITHWLLTKKIKTTAIKFNIPESTLKHWIIVYRKMNNEYLY